MFETSLRIEMASFRRLIALGFPAAAQLSLEVGVFAAASVLTGRLAPVALASHQIALNIASVTFMVPLGVSSAGAVRVGHAVGRRDTAGAERAGWTALLIGSAFMSVAAAAFVLAPRALVGAFSVDEGVLCVGTALLFVAAVFQLFDGLQCVATGVLRGLGQTRTPMLWNLLGHWLIGLPFGYVLCFVLDRGVVGLWWGLSTGLIDLRHRPAHSLDQAHSGAEARQRPSRADGRLHLSSGAAAGVDVGQPSTSRPVRGHRLLGSERPIPLRRWGNRRRGATRQAWHQAQDGGCDSRRSPVHRSRR